MTPAHIVTLRATLGWSQSRLARELGLNRSTICKWESGQHPIPPMAQKLLAQLVRRQTGQTNRSPS